MSKYKIAYGSKFRCTWENKPSFLQMLQAAVFSKRRLTFDTRIIVCRWEKHLLTNIVYTIASSFSGLI